jgi:hypothetical protein
MALEDQDPAAELEAQRQRLANALRTGVVENPDALAADRAEAQRRGMPVSRLRAIREVNGALPPANYDPDLPARAPATSNFLSNPANASVAHDDIESLTGLERIVARGFYTPEQSRQLIAQTAARNAREEGQSAARTPLGRLIERQGPAGRAAANLFRGIGERGSQLVGGVARVDQTLFGGIEDFARRQYDRVGIPIYDFRPDEQGRFSIQRVEPAADGTTRTTQMTRALETPAFGYEAGTTWEEVKARPLRNVIPYALESGLVSLPDMAAALTVLPAYVVSRMGEIGQDRAQNDARPEATVGDLTAALPAAAASAFLERLGTMGILGVGDELAHATLRGVLSASARAGLTEGLTEAGQSLVEYAGTNLGTEAGFNPVTALDQMAAGAVAGTPFGATVRGVTATVEVVTRRNEQGEVDAAAGEQAAQTLGELATLAEASKLRERDSQTFQQFIEQASEGTPVENVYVEAQAFAQALNDAGVPLEDVVAAIPALADQLPGALASGGDLRMTAGEFATHIAGTDATAALLPHLRTDPFGMSQTQAKDFMAARGEALQAEVETAAAQAQATEELRAGRERVQTRITEELNTTGRFTKDVNAAYASLPAAFYDVMGARLGITSEQAAERYPLKFASEMPTSTGREVLDQETDTVDLIHFSDSEGLTTSDPSKWGASRATQNSERERRNAGAPGRTYFGVRGVYNGEPATGIARRPFQYQAQVPASKLYNFDADPQGLKPTEGTPAEIATAYEKAIQAAGFSGYRSDAVVPGAVAVFDKIEVKPTSATDLVEKRFSPENIDDLLKHDDWSILTAENPRGEQATPEANAKAQAKLVADLKAMGVQYLPAIGRYGQVENSFVVAGITEQQARDLGRKYDQDSVLTRKGLIYQDGAINPARGIETHATRPDDFFTEVPGTGALFTVDVDFDTKEGGLNTETAAFKAWFSGSKVVDEDGQPLVVYHGTTSDFDAFDRERANIESNLGGGFYFSSQREDVAANYAGEGPDLTVRLGQRAERIANDTDREYNDPEVIAEARAQLAVEHGGMTLPVYLAIKNPAVLGGPNETVLTFEQTFDEETEEYGEPEGTLVDFVEAIREVASDPRYYDGDAETAAAQLFEAAADNDGVTVAQAFELLSKSSDGAFVYATDSDFGGLAGHEMVRAALERAGFDGIVDRTVDQKFGTQRKVGKSMEGVRPGTTHFVAFRPEQIKSVFNRGTFDPTDPRILYQSDPFYSALERAVETSSLTKAPAAQWKATLAKTPGVKKEEMGWTGLENWLDMGAPVWRGDMNRVDLVSDVATGGNITREAVLAYLRNGGIRVEEVVLGEPGADARLDARIEQLMEEGLSRQEAVAEAFAEGADGSPAQFSTYKLPGADDTYREILLTLPSIDGPSTHWDTPNVVAHARITERTDASGARVLFLEEVQSDWHQKGRDQGYQQPSDPIKQEEARLARAAAYEARDAARVEFAEEVVAEGEVLLSRLQASQEKAKAALGVEGDAVLAERIAKLNGALNTITGQIAAKEFARASQQASLLVYNAANGIGKTETMQAAVKRLEDAQLASIEADVAYDAASGETGIPDAPFRTSWSALVMKRMIRYAVDNGFEKVAWINGNQQNGGQTGGDGSFFYERNLVNVTNDLLKKYGARVEPVDFKGPEHRSEVEHFYNGNVPADALQEFERPPQELGIQNGFTITPQLAEAARAGFALFQRNRGQIAFGADVSQTPSVISLLRAADLSTFIHETGHFFLEATAHMANQPDAPADIVNDMSTVLNWFEPGMTQAQWNGMSLEQRRPYHEKWARGFEAYHFEGRAPSLALRDVFRRFSAWLKNVYKSLTALDVELTDEVRQVMDRMLASEAEIKEMEQVRGLAPAFATKPEFASEAEWAEYQKLGVEATAEAIEQLETRSARDMRWASGAKDRYVKSLQREAEEQRKTIRAEVTAEVMAEPVNRARAFLRRGLGENGEPVEGPTKLDLSTLKALYGEEGAWTALRRGGKYGEVATDGLHPDIAASMFGYPNGEALIEDLVNGEDSADKIKGMTDQRMLERYGDLSSPQDIERAANEAVANEARGKFVAAEMAMADKAIGKKSILNNAAKEFAAQVVNRLELKRLRPAQYLAAQGRAAKAADKALKADDLPAFATAKRNQLINLHTGRAVQQAQKDVEKTMRLFTRIVSAKDDSISKSRNMDLVNAARAILSSYGVGRVKNDPAGYMKALSQYDPTLYADIEPFVNGARGDAKPVVDLTYEQFQALRDTVNQLWVLSRRTKQIEIDGKLMDRAVVTEELGLRLEEIGIPEQAGLDRAPTDKDKIVRRLLGTRAALRRVESWARGVDAADRGPFRRFIWNPISAAADTYRAESGDYIRRFRALLDDMRAELKPGDIKAPEIGYTFGGKSELFHALLHTGNGSNKSKLLLGRGWGKKLEDGSLDDTRWQSFVDRLHTEGVLAAKDWAFIQAVWDLLEETKPGAQRAHHAIYGRYFDEVSADPVDTPFGQLRGGYVPALTDGFLVQDAVLRAEQEAIEGGDSAMFPAASNGFTKSRVEDYTRELALDLRLLPMHIDKVLKFTHLGPPVRDVARLLKDRGFSKKLQAFDPTAQSDLLLPWLQRAAKQLVETPSKGEAGKAADNFFSAVRSRVGMQLMFANVVNTAQQITGFSNVMLRVKPAVVGDALWRYVRDPRGVSDAAASQSVFLTNRMSTDIFEARQTITQLTKLNPSKKDEAVDFLKRHAYFMQSALQNVMDVVSWTAAYNQAVAKGENDRDAIRFADSVIRETQGTMAPEDVSRFETGAPFVRVFTQFAGYFNMMANLNATEVQITARSVGLKKGMGRLFYVYLMGFAIPALLGDAIAKALRGGWEDEEGDGYMDDLFAWFFSSQAKFALAAVPVVGQAGNAALGAFTKMPYDDRISMSPAVSVIESGLSVPAAAYKALVEGEEFNRADVRNTLNLLGILTGTPTGALAKPVGYGVGVAQGDIEPTGPVDAARGVVTGAPSPESRQ